MKMQFPYHSIPRAASGRSDDGRFDISLPQVGVISNLKSHRNRNHGLRPLDLPNALVIRHIPETPEQLARALMQFARTGVDVIVVDGGDGTVRDVLGIARQIYRDTVPRLAILPSGKTNALANDLGIDPAWSLGDIVAAHLANRVALRDTLTVHWSNGQRRPQHGFLFGFGAFVRATMLAQRVQRHGWFGDAAILATLAWALARICVGGPRSVWARGEDVRMSHEGADIDCQTVYLLLGSTLHRMPLGLKPFGRPRPGLKFLVVKTPLRRVLPYVLQLLRGTISVRLAERGCVRLDNDRFFLSSRKGFTLDGEHFPGGNLVLSRGAPVEFLVP